MAITLSGQNNVDKITASDGVIDVISGVNHTGVVTATTFKGDFEGNITGNVTGNINNTTLLFQIGGAEKLRIDSSGRLLVGTTAARVESNGFAVPLQVEGTSTATSSVIIARNSANASSSNLIFQKSRGTSTGSNTVIQSGDAVGTIIFEGSDGTNTDSLASIIGACDGTPGTNDVPGRLVFSTTADGAAFPTERLRITSAGSVRVGDNSSFSAHAAADNLVVGTTSGSNGMTILTGDATGNIFFSNGTANNGVIQYVHSTDPDSMIINSAGQIEFDAGGAERLRIDSSGHISQGGGATPSSTNGGVGLKYGIKSAANNIIIGETTSSSHNGLILESRLTGRSGGARTSQINIGQDGTGGHIIFSTAAGSADVTQRLKITRDGCVFANNFGIGTDSNWKIRANTGNTDLAFEYSTSSSLSDNNIKAYFQGSSTDARLIFRKAEAGSCGLEFRNGTTQKAYQMLDSEENMVYLAQSGVHHRFYVGGSTESFRVASTGNAFFTGNVGINQTDPQTQLNVKGTISTGRNVARELGTVISSSTNYNSARDAENVIDGKKNYENGDNDWLTSSNQRVNANLVIDLGSSINVDRAVIYNQNEYQSSHREVKNFTLEGSNDNSSWTAVLDDDMGRSNGHEPNPGWSFRIPQGFADDNEGNSYRYWRFTMKTFHGSDAHGGIMEIELYEASNVVTNEVTTSSLVAGDVYAQTGCFNRITDKGGTTGITISNDGQVTKPSSCAFNYTCNGNQSLSSGDTITSWTSTNSRGFENTQTGGYLSSGIFTAPVTGAYFFTSTILLSGVGSATGIHIFWQKNGSGAHTYWETRTDGTTGYGGYEAVSGQCTMQLDAGETCRIKTSFSGSMSLYGTDANWGNWGGFLIG